MEITENQNLDKIQLWTQHEMLGALFAGFVIGFVFGMALFK